MARYTQYYELEVSHPGLNKYRHIRGTDRYVVAQKALAQEAQWEAEWDRKRDVQQRRDARQAFLYGREAKKQEAADRTRRAQDDLEAVAGVLSHTLITDDRVDWEGLKDHDNFAENPPPRPSAQIPDRQPTTGDDKYKPKFDFWCHFSAKRKEAAVSRARQSFERDLEIWEEHKASLEKTHARALEQHCRLLTEWEERRAAFLEKQRARNVEIDERRLRVAEGDEGAVYDLIDLVLSSSQYPDFVNIDYSLDYDAESKALIIDYELPAPDSVPTLKEVRFNQSRDEFTEKHVSEAEKSRLYDNLIYQIALRTLHESFEAEEHGHITRVTFNGWVSYVDKATGADQRSCILSVSSNRDDFTRIELSRVDPKECFKALKGVAAAKLIGLAPVPPLQRSRKPDPRLIESKEVLASVDDSVNVAAMDWADFEHLVRQIFEAEYASSAGAEVRVTRASRDGGVDAIIYDPDPIRGGKIVIQAKRYTNTVDVSAVRDLYGAVTNERALKGILVTTSQYGPDAWKFAQDKPLTLIDGGNLLYLLEKAGVKARIDLQEAKLLQREEAQRRL